MFVVVVTLVIVGSQEKPPTPGKGTFFMRTHTLCLCNIPRAEVCVCELSVFLVSSVYP